MRGLPPLRAVVAFEATVRLGSMVLAAAELGITPSAVSHRVATLEAHFGQALFRRASGRLEPSAAGMRLAGRLAAGLDEIATACREFAPAPGRRAVGVQVAVSLATKWLRPRLGRFLAAHPGIALRIVDAPGRPDFSAGLDFALVYGADAPPGAERLLAERVRPLCSPALRRRLPADASAADLSALPLLHSRTVLGWPEWFRHMGGPAPPAGGLRFDRSHLAIDAACEGHGVVLESDLLTEAERRDGRLVAALADPRAALASVGYALVLSGTPLPAAALAFLDWLRGEAALHPGRQAG
jgi:LysR family glycine cleavage system transcriptional activator